MTTGAGSTFRETAPRLWESREGERTAFWTEALGDPPQVYGERIRPQNRRWIRRWDPYRSKLAAALARGWRGLIPAPEERWLYLGAATGTTASHFADLVGPRGAVYSVERSVRPFARLLDLAERYPNLFPILADVRRPESYLHLVPPVRGIYSDVAQPDQAALARENAELFLTDGSPLLLVLKLGSMGRDRTPDELAKRAVDELRPLSAVQPSLTLEPYHRLHRFGVWTRGAPRSASASGRPPRRSRPTPGRRRRDGRRR